MIDLAPLAVAPPAPPQEVAPGPQMTEAQPKSRRLIRRRPCTTRLIRRLRRPSRRLKPPKPDPGRCRILQQTAQELKPDIPPPPQPQDMKVPDLPKEDNAEAIPLAAAPALAPKPRAHKEPPPKAHERAERQKP